MTDLELQDRLRALPSVEELLQTEPLRSAAARSPRSLSVVAAQKEIERARGILRAGGERTQVDRLATAAAAEVARRSAPSLRRVINATGVVVHTNIGRAPLAREAREAVERTARDYTNLEYDLAQGRRGSRHAHVEDLIRELTGADAALAVNNNAAAVVLAVAAVAGGSEVLVSRGQLVEIGGSFRIPDILAAAGAQLVEVGTTNRTRLADYERAIGAGTAGLMRVHTSNFRTVGFTEEVGIEDLCSLGRRSGLPVIDDLGSGRLAHAEPGAAGDERLERLAAVLADEPSARRSVDAGADVVCFSGDKLLGGPQAGLVAGRSEAVERMRSHPLARALRLDKLSLAALEATLRLHRDAGHAATDITVLRMLSASGAELTARAERMRAALGCCEAQAGVEVIRVAGRVGGGALPLAELEGPALAVRPRSISLDALQSSLRASDPPVVARAHDGALLLDPRTMTDAEADVAASAVLVALSENVSGRA